MNEALERTKALLGLVEDTYARLERLFKAMAATTVQPEAVQKYLTDVSVLYLDPGFLADLAD